jgi:hypothetical protein
MEDYLYVDDRRLNSYVEQIGSPVTYDKSRGFTFSIGLTGPSASGSQQTHPRPLTQHEKLTRFLTHLKENDLLGDGRLTYGQALSGNARAYQLEVCDAVKVFIPPASPEQLVPKDSSIPDFSTPFLREDPLEFDRRVRRREAEDRRALLEGARAEIAGFGGLDIWISQLPEAERKDPKGRGQLLLIVGSQKDDTVIGAFSAFSSLTWLFRSLSGDLRRSVLHSALNEWRSGSPPSPLEKSFLADPVATLLSLGALDSGPRTIETLYRVRDAIIYKETDDRDDRIATIGYPIFIASSGL